MWPMFSQVPYTSEHLLLHMQNHNIRVEAESSRRLGYTLETPDRARELG